MGKKLINKGNRKIHRKREREREIDSESKLAVDTG